VGWILLFFFVVLPGVSYLVFCFSLMKRGIFGILSGLLLLGLGCLAIWVIMNVVGSSISVTL
jgi:hypothetical protein